MKFLVTLFRTDEERVRTTYEIKFEAEAESAEALRKKIANGFDYGDIAEYDPIEIEVLDTTLQGEAKDVRLLSM